MCFQVIQAYYFSKINAWFELITFHSFFWNLCSYNHAILHVHLKKEDVHSNVWPARRSRGAGRSPLGPRSLLAGGGACNLTAYQQGRLCVRGSHGRQNQPAAFKRSTHLLHAPCFVSGPARRLSGCERLQVVTLFSAARGRMCRSNWCKAVVHETVLFLIEI